MKKTTVRGGGAVGEAETSGFCSLEPIAAPAAAFPADTSAVDWAAACRFLTLIGRTCADREHIVLAVYPPEASKPGRHFIATALTPQGIPMAEIEQLLRERPTHSLGFIVQPPAPQPADWGEQPEHRNTAGFTRAWGASNNHIGRFIGGFVDLDGGLPIEEQLALPELAQLLPPTVANKTGGKSTHLYWLLKAGERWTDADRYRRFQRALAAAINAAEPGAGADQGIHNPSRVMRLPGGIHPTGGGRCEVLFADGPRYTVAQLEALTDAIEERTGTTPLPPAAPRSMRPVQLAGGGRDPNGEGWFDRCSHADQLELAASMLRTIPPRGVPNKSGTYMNALRAVFALVNHFGADGARSVIDRAGWHSPYWDVESKISEADGSNGIQSLIFMARENGWRHPNAAEIDGARARGEHPQQQPEDGPYIQADGGPLARSVPRSPISASATLEGIGAAADVARAALFEPPPPLPPEPPPERLVAIASALEALDAQQAGRIATVATPEVLSEEIRRCGLFWPHDADAIHALADRIGHTIAAHGAADRLTALRDLLIAEAGGGGRKEFKERIEVAANAWRGEQLEIEAKRAALIAERDARATAEAEQLQRQALQVEEERRQQQLATTTGRDVVLLAVGSGWAVQEGGGETRSALHHGQLFDTLLRDLAGRLRFNLRGLTPTIDSVALRPSELQGLYVRLSSKGWNIPKEHAIDAVLAAAHEHEFDPFRTYLEEVEVTASPLPDDEWRALDQHLLGIDDPVARRFLPQWLLGAVARTMLPGCGMRRSPVLIGGEGLGKTTLGEILFTPELYVSNLHDMGKDDLLRCHSAACVELSELDGITRRSDQEHLKAFLTAKYDTFRAPYAAAAAKYVRRFVFIGTSNTPPLRDSSENTRFVCIQLPRQFLPLEWVRQNREALWARAVAEYRDCNPVLGVNEPWDRWSEADRIVFAERNAEHRTDDPWKDKVLAFLEHRRQMRAVPVSIPDVLDWLGVPLTQQSHHSGRVRRLAEAAGWAHRRARLPGEKEKRQGLWPPEGMASTERENTPGGDASGGEAPGGQPEGSATAPAPDTPHNPDGEGCPDGVPGSDPAPPQQPSSSGHPGHPLLR